MRAETLARLNRVLELFGQPIPDDANVYVRAGDLRELLTEVDRPNNDMDSGEGDEHV